MARQVAYHLLDVFTDKRFCGNPLAVIDAAEALSDDEMQRIAREFNLSETVFLFDPQNPVHTARLRIFTPMAELPFAGHPTIGAAALIAQMRASDVIARSDVALVLESKIGLLHCEARRVRDGGVYAQCALPLLPQKLDLALTGAEVAAALMLAPEDIGFDRHLPTRYSAGVAFLYVPVASRAALERARRGATFAAVAGDGAGVYIYTRETLDPACAVHARMLAHPRLGIDEDPATGSAAAGFAAVAHEFEAPDDGDHEFFIEQGHLMGRPSRITLGLAVEAGALAGLRIGGKTVRVGEGTLFL